MNPVIAQAVGIVAMFFNIFSFQQKKASRLIACQLIGASLFVVNYFMLGATMGAVLNVAAAVRAFVFLKREKFHSDHIAWLIGFCVVYVARVLRDTRHRYKSNNNLLDLIERLW